MSYAKNTLNVNFKEAVQEMRGFRRSEMIIRFRYQNDFGEEGIVKSLNASALYKDWYHNRDICPADDVHISHLHILLPTCVALDVTDKVTFERLMNAIEDVTVGRIYYT